MSVPFADLSAREWERLGNAAALLALVLVVVFSSYAVYWKHTQDFRGYYAAGRVVLAGGNPYDYEKVAAVLREVTGFAGNNPYYYPPWLCLAFLPFAALPYHVARLVRIVANWGMLLAALALAQDAMSWRLSGWRRWLVWLSAFYLYGWVSLKFEQLGIALLLVLAWALRSIRRQRDVQAGFALALLLSKPNVTALTFLLLLLWSARNRRRLVWMAIASLAVLALVGTLLVPGWITQVSRPGFGIGLTQLTDGPDEVVQRRRTCTLLHWLEALGVTGAPAWGIYALLAGGAVLWMVRSPTWRRDVVYAACLGSALTLLLTPYALMYDYVPLSIALLWVYRRLTRTAGWRRWLVWAVLLFMFSVLIWAGPEYDGYWLVLSTCVLFCILEWFDSGTASRAGANA